MREETAKARAKSRADGRCEGCRATGQEIALEVHHARYDRGDDDWTEGDFWVLCMTCHDGVTINTRSRKLGIPASRWRGIVRAAIKAAAIENGVPSECVDYMFRGRPGPTPDWRWGDSESAKPKRLGLPVNHAPAAKVAPKEVIPKLKPHRKQYPSEYVHPLKR